MMNVAFNYKNIQSRPIQIASNLVGGYTSSSLVQTANGPTRFLFFAIGSVASNYLYQSYFGNLDDAITDPLSALEHSVSSIASGKASLVDYGVVAGTGYAGYAGYTSLSSSGTAASEGAVVTEESAGLLAELGTGALETIEMLAPLAILV
jgi:hypothetical protein